jgi:hypothetical protein
VYGAYKQDKYTQIIIDKPFNGFVFFAASSSKEQHKM